MSTPFYLDDESALNDSEVKQAPRNKMLLVTATAVKALRDSSFLPYVSFPPRINHCCHHQTHS